VSEEIDLLSGPFFVFLYGFRSRSLIPQHSPVISFSFSFSIPQHSQSMAYRQSGDFETALRNVVVAIDLSDTALKATQWAAHEFCRPGDIVHLVHVSRILSPQTTIQHVRGGGAAADLPMHACTRHACAPGMCQHELMLPNPTSPLRQGYAGSSYTVPDPHPIDETAHVATVREIVKARFATELDYLKIPHALHICELRACIYICVFVLCVLCVQLPPASPQPPIAAVSLQSSTRTTRRRAQ
jgi:hypothetical protein